MSSSRSRVSGLGLLVDPEEAVRQRDLVDLADDQVRVVPQDGAADLAADDGLLRSSTFESYRRRGRDRGGSSSGADTLLTPNDDPERAGFTKTGYVEFVGVECSSAVDDRNSGVAMPALRGDDVGERLVHAQRRALDVAADVGDAGQLEQALHRSVLAELAVQDGEHQRRA